MHGTRREPEAASEIGIGQAELHLRPRSERSGDLVEAVPGMFTAQHAGGGKADQYFLRGFDADHGTDVAFFVDGVPVNLPSHAHGQGFSDLHFVIPELVLGLSSYKGPYYAQFGDFATAGAVNLHLAEALPKSFARAEVGQYGMGRVVVAESPQLGEGWRAVVAAEAARQDGPFTHPEDLVRLNLYGRVTRDLRTSHQAVADLDVLRFDVERVRTNPGARRLRGGRSAEPSPGGVRGAVHRPLRRDRPERGRAKRSGTRRRSP